METCAPSVSVDHVQMCVERIVELVHALIRPLCAKIHIHVDLHGSHDTPLPIRLVEGQVLDNE